MLSIALSPGFVNDGTVFVGTQGNGVWTSTNRGNSWRPANAGLSSLNVLDLVVSPAFSSDRTLFARTNSGVFRSTNAGESWDLLQDALADLDVLTLALSPSYAADHTIYAGTRAHGIRKSIDGGSTWVAIGAELSDASM